MERSLKNKLQAATVGGAFAIALVLTQYFEGTRYMPYRDVGGVLTVCEGITGSDVIEDKAYTQQECDLLIKKHIGIAKQQVDRLVKVKLPDTVFGALYSFTYNVGAEAFKESTLLMLLNAGKRIAACEELKRWIKVKKITIKGLMTRREIEEAVCKADKVDDL